MLANATWQEQLLAKREELAQRDWAKLQSDVKAAADRAQKRDSGKLVRG